MIFHSGINCAGPIQLFRQNKTSQLVWQSNTAQTDACLCSTLDALIQSMGGTYHKGNVSRATSRTLC